MYIDTSKSVQRGKTYYRHLLRENYREGGKVKHRTLANLTGLPDEVIAAMKLALRHKGDLAVVRDAKEVVVTQGIRLGAVICLHTIAVRLGVVKALGWDRDGKLALWQVMARLIDQGSRLSAVRLAKRHGVCDVLGLDTFTEDHLYANLSWLAEHQEEIEQRLFHHRYGSAPPRLFLYDVTSSYMEGTCNDLGAFGYNRDGKKGKKQLVAGLLTDGEGEPLAIQLYQGNTNDPPTFLDAVDKRKVRLGAEEIAVVGDRGMIKALGQAALGQARFR